MGTGCFGRNVLGEALLVGLRGASLEEFAGNGWFFSGEADVRVLRGASLCIEGRLGLFFGSEAGDSWLRGASLLSRMLVLAEMFYVKRL